MRIVLCDARRLMVEALAASLALRGHEVVGVTTDLEAAHSMIRERDPDVCMVDIAFAGVDGVRAVERMSATRCKVLVLTARTDAAVVQAVLAAGAAGVLGKDQRLDEVLLALKWLADGATRIPVRIHRPADQVADLRDQGDAARLRFLTRREREALHRIAQGESTKEIASSMQVAYSTARTHVQNVLTKLGVRSRLQAAAIAARAGVTYLPAAVSPSGRAEILPSVSSGS